MEEVLELCDEPDTVRQDLVPDLIARRPHHDAGIIAVVFDHIGDVPFPPIIELDMVVIIGLSVVPDIEGFDHHHQSHLVT